MLVKNYFVIHVTNVSPQKYNINDHDYIIRAKKSALLLKTSGEIIDNNLLIAMVLKGLQVKFKIFTIVITQEKVLTFN